MPKAVPPDKPERHAGKQSSAGRPSARQAADVRQRLLATARRLFITQGFAAVSIRAIATETGVNPAMIHYYFRSKQGLYEAMLSETIGPVLVRLRAALESSPATSALLPGLIETYMRTLADNPWLPQLIMREVFSEQGAFREAFVRLFAARGENLASRILAQEQTAGRLRTDLDSRLLTLSMLSLMLFPFFAMPVVKPVFGIEPDPVFVERLIRHTQQLFSAATAPGETT